MTISAVAENTILNLIYNATAWANYADNASSSPQTTIFLTLQTADPLDAGTAATSEVAYTSYARASTTRSNASGGWTASTAGSTSPHTVSVSFPAGTGGSGTATHFTTCKSVAAPTATDVLWSGTVSPNIVTGNGVTPQLTTATTVTLE